MVVVLIVVVVGAATKAEFGHQHSRLVACSRPSPRFLGSGEIVQNQSVPRQLILEELPLQSVTFHVWMGRMFVIRVRGVRAHFMLHLEPRS